MNDKKKLRRLKFLLNGNTQRFWMYDQRYYLGFENQLEPHLQNGKVEILKLTAELNLSEEELKEIWREVTKRKVISRSEKSKKHVVLRRDNKTVKVGSGGSNRNKIRYPKKCRKTAWKRFYKLFPNLKPEEK